MDKNQDKKPALKFQQMFVESITKQTQNPELETLIGPVGQLDTQQVLEVYRKDYQARLTQALGETFEGVWAVLGDESFFELCREFLSHHPSQTQDLGQIGTCFPGFIKNHDLLVQYPFISLLAQFEQEFWFLFHAPKQPNSKEWSPPGIEELLEQRLKFIKNFKLFSWDYKIYDMWSQRKDGITEGLTSFYSQQNIVLFKTKALVQAVELGPEQFKILHLLLSGKTLDQAIELQEIEPEQLQTLFQTLQSNKLILPM